jgi:hypothetical protein
VKGIALRVGAAVFFATAVLLALVLGFPGSRRAFVGAYELVLGGVGLVVLVASFQRLRPRPWERSPFERRPEKPERPLAAGELERIDRLVVLGSSNAFDLHFRLRPLLRDLARERLYASYGVELDRNPERAQPLLGDELWELVRPDREVGRRDGPGLGPERLERLVGKLEAL